MGDPAQNLDPPLPADIVATLEAAGLSPTLVNVFIEFNRMKEAIAQASVIAEEQKQPLGKLLPVGLKYERARRAIERGDLQAEMPNGRWLSTESWVARWLAAIGWPS
jgi:hypothetical protein